MKMTAGVRRGVYATAAIATGLGAIAYGTFISRDTIEKMEMLRLIDEYVEQNLDPEAVKFSDVPARLKERAVYMDADRDGDFESYIFWDNRMGPDRKIMIIRSTEGGVDFPTLSCSAPRPDELPRGLSVDYHFINGSDVMDCVGYTLDHNINPECGGYRLIPIRLEKLGKRYYWSEIEAPSQPPSKKQMNKPRNTPKPGLRGHPGNRIVRGGRIAKR